MTRSSTECQSFADQVEALSLEGIDHYKNGYYDQALVAFGEAARFCRESGDVAGEARQRILEADVYCASDQQEQALASYRAALALYSRLGDNGCVANLHNNIGLLLTQLKQYDDALDAFEAALQQFESDGALEQVADQLGNMGSVCRDSEDYNRSLDYYRQALVRFEGLELPVRIADQHANIGYIYALQENKVAALEHFTQAAALYRRNGEERKARQTSQNIEALGG